MMASLVLLALAWLFPLGFLAWSYYQHRQMEAQPAPCRTVVETVQVDVHAGVWMVTSDDAPRSATAMPDATGVARGATCQASLPKAQAVVRIQTEDGNTIYRRCEPFLN